MTRITAGLWCGIAVAAIFAFLASWNEFLFALLLTAVRAQTTPIVIANFQTQFGLQGGAMTALAMLSTMRLEGHTALVHTAAASSLGRMLNRLCLADGVEIVNVVRRTEQASILRELGAGHIVDSTDPDFTARLTEAVGATGATLAFDAVGGGPLAGQILMAMESACLAASPPFGPYGSPTHKQVYVYGRLDPSPTTVPSRVGMAWGVGGWLLTYHLQRIGAEATRALRERVAAEITTTFATQYSHEISLAEALRPEAIRGYGRMATRDKYVIVPAGGR